MKKIIMAFALTLPAIPFVAKASGGMMGDCYDCHTMHNSENGLPVAIVDGAISESPLLNLLRLDCIACHAADPTGGSKLMTLPGGSVVPQVAHGGGTDDLAGGNFSFGIGDSSKVHNVVELFAGQWDHNGGDPSDPLTFGAPPGKAPAVEYHSYNKKVFTTNISTPFDAFTCAGARGCHGTRSQLLSGETIDNGTDNVFTNEVWRTGIAAVSGAHHNNYDGAKDATNYPDDETAFHDGQRVADGYRFIVGLKGYGNEVDRWSNIDASSHNEYYGGDAGLPTDNTGCALCHIEGYAGGRNSYSAFNSTIRVPDNSVSGFCITCHGKFHSSGDGGDIVNNGISGAFLRHPADYVIPNTGEFAAYTVYNITAPVARPTLFAATSSTVTPGTDMVMCLSCHKAHGTQYDYKLRFDYTAMIAGGYADIASAVSQGGCLACHTSKGVLPENR